MTATTTTETTEPRIYRVPDFRLDGLVTKFAKHARKAERLGVAVPTLAVVGEATEPDEDNPLIVRVYKLVQVDGLRPSLSGWTLVAHLIHDGVTTYASVLPGETMPEQYRNAPSACDHCGKARHRLDTYILRGADGGHQQVGRNCLGDFLPGYNLAGLAAWAEAFDFIEEDEDDKGWDITGGPRQRQHLNTDRFLALTACEIRVHGWVSGAEARENGLLVSTAERVKDRALKPRHEAASDKPVSELDVERAKAARAWAAALASDPKINDYEATIAQIATNEHFPIKMAGFAASILKAHERHLQRAAEAAARPTSQYLGQPGAKLEVTVKVDSEYPIDGDYGTSWLYRLSDEAGNVLIWKSSAGDLRVGKTYTLKGTVKAHEVYTPRDRHADPINQTVLTRCKVVGEPQIAEAA